jgi:hypothetical protein
MEASWESILNTEMLRRPVWCENIYRREIHNNHAERYGERLKEEQKGDACQNEDMSEEQIKK